MYLSRLRLNPGNRQIQQWLGDCHAMHRVIMSGFPHVTGDTARAALGVLYRVEFPAGAGPVHVLVQSAEPPRWSIEANGVAVDEARDLAILESGFAPGREYRFRLLANPTRRVHRLAAEGPDHRVRDETGAWRELAQGEDHRGSRRLRAEPPSAVGKRVELRREEDQLAWLQRKGLDQCGFELRKATVSNGFAGEERRFTATRADPGPRLSGRQETAAGRRQLTFATALFEGELRVTDAAAFAAAFRAGIGPARAFGCGLLSLAPK